MLAVPILSKSFAIMSDTEPCIEVPELESPSKSFVASIFSSLASIGNHVSLEDMLKVASSEPGYQFVKQVVITSFAKSRCKLDPILKLRLSLSKNGLVPSTLCSPVSSSESEKHD